MFDAAVFNSVLDACICAGDLVRARSFAQVMRQRFGGLDIVTYNALVMGFTFASGVRGIRSVLKTIADVGLKPKMTSPKIAS